MFQSTQICWKKVKIISWIILEYLIAIFMILTARQHGRRFITAELYFRYSVRKVIATTGLPDIILRMFVLKTILLTDVNCMLYSLHLTGSMIGMAVLVKQMKQESIMKAGSSYGSAAETCIAETYI